MSYSQESLAMASHSASSNSPTWACISAFSSPVVERVFPVLEGSAVTRVKEASSTLYVPFSEVVEVGGGRPHGALIVLLL
eukprot:14298140-Alexandrium_andersonii.AAC.1